MIDPVTFLVLALTTYRITRFAILDTLIDEPRDAVHSWLLRVDDDGDIPMWRFKLQDLLSCPYCLSVWVAAAVVAFWSLVVRDEWLGWPFLLIGPAAAGASLIPYRYIDSDD